MEKIILIIFLFISELYGQNIDSLKQKNVSLKRKIIIDIDNSIVFLPIAFSVGISRAIDEKQYLGAKIGFVTGTISIINYYNNKNFYLIEVFKIDLFHKYIFNKNFEVDNGIRSALILYELKSGEDVGLTSIGIYTQPSYGWKYFKFGTMIYISLDNNFKPVYFNPLFIRITI